MKLFEITDPNQHHVIDIVIHYDINWDDHYEDSDIEEGVEILMVNGKVVANHIIHSDNEGNRRTKNDHSIQLLKKLGHLETPAARVVFNLDVERDIEYLRQLGVIEEDPGMFRSDWVLKDIKEVSSILEKMKRLKTTKGRWVYI